MDSEEEGAGVGAEESDDENWSAERLDTSSPSSTRIPMSSPTWIPLAPSAFCSRTNEQTKTGVSKQTSESYFELRDSLDGR